MTQDQSQFEQRKRDHIALALMPSNQSSELNHFDALSLIHEAIPDLNFSELSIHSNRFKERIEKPFFVSSMTAGHKQALMINTHLIEACAEMNWAMGVGSQRRELTDKEASLDWKHLRKIAPKVDLFGNLGLAQVITTPIDSIKVLVDALEAKAMIIHCNPLQECIQPEGTADFKGAWRALEALKRDLHVPLIVKETGCGFSKNTLLKLEKLLPAAVDISGAGGTHWGRIEGRRAQQHSVKEQTGLHFQNWGISTVESLRQAKSLNPSFELWGSGGVRHGLDAAKLFALGASSVGFAKILLEEALLSTQALINRMHTIEYELKTALFCTGSPNLDALKDKLCL